MARFVTQCPAAEDLAGAGNVYDYGHRTSAVDGINLLMGEANSLNLENGRDYAGYNGVGLPPDPGSDADRLRGGFALKVLSPPGPAE